MKEWRVSRLPISGPDASRNLADKLNEISQEGWDIDGMDVMGRERNQMIIISSKDKPEDI